MTIEEKAMQLSCVYTMGLLGTEGIIRSQLDAQLGQGIGHIAGLGTFGHKTLEKIAKTINAIQHYLVMEARLKIPAIFHNGC
jgi:beta-glucosidase